MARTMEKWFRFYVDGYDLSGNSRSIGPFGVEHEEANVTAWTDTVNTYLKNRAAVNLGTYNAVLDNTAGTLPSGVHSIISTSGVQRDALLAMGFGAAPVAGDPCFGGQFLQSGYQATTDGGAVTVTVPFSGWSTSSSTLAYGSGFGQLIHAAGSATAANAAVGVDSLRGAASTAGGYMLYHVLAVGPAGDSTFTISVDDSATNANDAAFAPLTGATTGSITATSNRSGIVVLSTTATVRRYLRWQIALGTATSVNFVLSFHRG